MKCRVCDGLSLSKYVKVRKWELHKCKDCGYVQVINKPDNKELEEIYSESYFGHSKYKDTKTLFKEYEYRKSLLLSTLNEKSDVLDYGCAKADFITYCNTIFNFSGVDYSKDAIRLAKNQFPYLQDKFFTTEDLDLIKDNSFDGIVLWDVIEHLWNPSETLTCLDKKLKPEGYIYISTPKIDSFFAKITGKFWPFMTPPEHLGFFSKKSFEKLADKHNYTIVNYESKGKWVNLAFLMYKLKRIFPKLIPSLFIKIFQTKHTSNWSVYVPTNDIQYLILKKK